MARKRQAFGEGDLFLVPQADGKASLGQVLRVTKRALNSVICGFYDVRRELTGVSVDAADLDVDKLIALQFVTPDLLGSGVWPVVGTAPPLHLERMPGLSDLEAKGYLGAKIIGSGIIRKFLDAFYGLRPWDNWADPEYLDKLLLAPDRKPSGRLILTKASR